MKTLSGRAASKIGIGSYGIGGRGHRDVNITKKDDDEKYIEALVYTLDRGINFTEIALGYGHGQALALFKRALDKSTVTREDIFLTHSLYPRDLGSMDVIKEDIDSFYRIMDTDFADSTLVTQSLIMEFGESPVYTLLRQLLESEKSRYVSLSNASPAWIRKFKQEFGDKFIAHEGHLSFEVRALQDKGVFSVCEELGVENIIWRPLRQNRTLQHDWQLLAELAEKYQKTPNQIILNWICSLGFRPMVMSANRRHIDENIASAEFLMSGEDYARITNFRPQNYSPPPVDWEGLDGGDEIVGLANQFEDHLTTPN